MCASKRIAVGHDRWKRAKLNNMELEMKKTFHKMRAYATIVKAKLQSQGKII